MAILVTGGAGYIGSFMVKKLIENEFEVVVADSLENGHEDTIDKRVTFVRGNLLDADFVNNLFSNHKLHGVIHFAGYISMKESMENPGKYFKNNIFASLNILESMKEYKVNNFIFSSTAGVYGNPIKIPIPEDHPKSPTNSYGESKLIVERILPWYKEIYGINFAALRYFNAAGATLDGSMGEDHYPETHIIPNAINSVLNNSEFILYGNDYETRDGTCVRDYIHVLDLTEAHILAFKKLLKDKGGYFYNVGTGKGSSNKEVVDMINKVSGKNLKVKIEKRRPGDASSLVADPTKINTELGFSPKYSDLETIIKTAWLWHENSVKLKAETSK